MKLEDYITQVNTYGQELASSLYNVDTEMNVTKSDISNTDFRSCLSSIYEAVENLEDIRNRKASKKDLIAGIDTLLSDIYPAIEYAISEYDKVI